MTTHSPAAFLAAVRAELRRLEDQSKQVPQHKLALQLVLALYENGSAPAFGRLPYRGKACIVDGELFPSVAAAARHCGVTGSAIIARIKRGIPNHKYVD